MLYERFMDDSFNDWFQLSPDDVESKLGHLIRIYLRSQSAVVARSLVSTLQLLLCHPDYKGSLSQRCAYRKMLQYWKLESLKSKTIMEDEK